MATFYEYIREKDDIDPQIAISMKSQTDAARWDVNLRSLRGMRRLSIKAAEIRDMVTANEQAAASGSERLEKMDAFPVEEPSITVPSREESVAPVEKEENALGANLSPEFPLEPASSGFGLANSQDVSAKSNADQEIQDEQRRSKRVAPEPNVSEEPKRIKIEEDPEFNLPPIYSVNFDEIGADQEDQQQTFLMRKAAAEKPAFFGSRKRARSKSTWNPQS